MLLLFYEVLDCISTNMLPDTIIPCFTATDGGLYLVLGLK